MEEIIINGVNVAECKFLENNVFNCLCLQMSDRYEQQMLCENKNCYYKQLKRLEQKNECLKEKLIIAQNSDNKTIEILKENAELKKELQKYKDMEAKGLEEFKDVGGCWGCGIQLASDEYFASCRKYKQALEEIRKIINSDVSYDDIELIINEVLDGRNTNSSIC